MEFESNTDILRDLMNQLHALHKENARLIQDVDHLKSLNNQLADVNLVLTQERDDLNVEKAELNRKLKSIQSLFL
jgi:hypothetical protein